MLTSIRAVGSFTVPLRPGVVSLLSSASRLTSGAVMSASTVALAGAELLPAASLATTLICWPSLRLPGLATLQFPAASATVLAVVPFG